MLPTSEDHFWDRVVKTDDCWLWIGGRCPLGYGRLNFRGVTTLAHRLGYQLVKGEIPEGLVLDHLCRNPSCVNPDHLEAVTQRENILRGEANAAVNARKTHCIHGHEFSPENTYVDKKGTRACLACGIRRRREWRRRVRARGGKPS